MNGLKEKILQETKAAMKGEDALRLSTLRMLASVIHNREIEKRTKLMKEKGEATEKDWTLSDEEVLAAVQTEVKKRREAAEQYEKGGRPELARKEEAELKMLQGFLPPQLSEEEIEATVRAAAAKLGKEGLNQGALMKEAMLELKGQAEGSAVAKIAARVLASLKQG